MPSISFLIGTVVGRARLVVATSLAIASFSSFSSLPSPAAADTIELKTGGAIENCRVIKKDATHLHLRSPSGTMAVPQEIVARVISRKSIFDTYDEKRAALAREDAAGHFALATWCQKTGGLRPEMKECLQIVVGLQPNHTGARHLLGYVRADGRWQAAPRLTLYVEMKKGGEHETKLREQLAMMLAGRDDVTLGRGPRKADDFASALIEASVTTFINSGATFYGQRLRGPTSRATVALGVRAAWLGPSAAPLTLEGETPASVPDAKTQAVTDSFVRNALTIDAFLDRINAQRMTQLELAHKARAGKDAGEGAATDAGDGTAEKKTGGAR